MPKPASLNDRNAAIIAKVKPRKRSYSAILSQELTGEELGEMLYVSRNHMALIPQEAVPREGTMNFQTLSKTLPTVTGKKAVGRENKVKSLRQGRFNNSKVKDTQDDASPSDKLPPIEPEGGQIINVKISTTSPVKEEADAKTKTSPAHNAKPNKEKSRSPQTLSPKIVSIGDVTEPDKTTVKIKHHPSSGVKGRLSSGWSSPVPIKGLSGSPIHTTKGNREESKTKKGMEGVGTGDSESLHRASTPGMMVNINITDFLGTDSDPDNQEQENSGGTS